MSAQSLQRQTICVDLLVSGRVQGAATPVLPTSFWVVKMWKPTRGSTAAPDASTSATMGVPHGDSLSPGQPAVHIQHCPVGGRAFMQNRSSSGNCSIMTTLFARPISRSVRGASVTEMSVKGRGLLWRERTCHFGHYYMQSPGNLP